jgi:hypothetical protein
MPPSALLPVSLTLKSTQVESVTCSAVLYGRTYRSLGCPVTFTGFSICQTTRDQTGQENNTESVTPS